MSANNHRTVAVIGGGIGGLTAALAFARDGSTVTVHEQATEIAQVGAGIQITPNGARALIALGLGDPLDRIGVIAQEVVPMDGISGQPVARFDLTKQQPNYRFILRADLIAMLATACTDAGVDIKLNAHIDAVPNNADLTIGADGLHSIVRPALNGAAEPFFTKQVAWRAIVAHDAKPEAQIWMQPGQHVVTYPLPDGRLNIVAVQERDAWAAEGWFHADDPENLRLAFAGSCPKLKGILAKVTETNLWGLCRHDVARNWVTDNTALLGDAAHPTLPFLAQGANLAIEDAYVLARTCGQQKTLKSALMRYEALRKPRVRRAIATANANAVNYHLSGLRRTVSLAVLRGIGSVAPSAFINRLGWLYDHDVTS